MGGSRSMISPKMRRGLARMGGLIMAKLGPGQRYPTDLTDAEWALLRLTNASGLGVKTMNKRSTGTRPLKREASWSVERDKL